MHLIISSYFQNAHAVKLNGLLQSQFLTIIDSFQTSDDSSHMFLPRSHYMPTTMSTAMITESVVEKARVNK